MITISEIKIKRLANGGRILIHPSGVRVRETAKQIADRKAERREQLVGIQTQVTADDALDDRIEAMDPEDDT